MFLIFKTDDFHLLFLYKSDKGEINRIKQFWLQLILKDKGVTRGMDGRRNVSYNRFTLNKKKYWIV